jgi:hypothetical protein
MCLDLQGVITNLRIPMTKSTNSPMQTETPMLDVVFQEAQKGDLCHA